MKTLLKLAAVLSLLLLGGFFVCSEGSLPDMALPDAEGNAVSLRDKRGRAYGVIMYLSRAPCGSHPRVAGKIDKLCFPQLAASHSYHPIFVYGDLTEAEAAKFAEKIEMPVLLDAGKHFARAVGIDRYYALIIFEPDGSIVYRHDGSFPYPPSGRTYAEFCDHCLESSFADKLGCPRWN
ncbi:MAG: redoxin domain-containing protein [Deltaproteobacteria bacterium]|nr:redoxin domain-containing protein [Deltaproteobacteria bacterium]